MILFHHRAETGLPSRSRRVKAGCRGWIRTTTLAFKGHVLLLDDPAMNWWPARVTLPVQRIKSPLHHFNACGRNGARGRIRTCTGDALDVVSLLLDYASEMDGASCRCCPGSTFLQRKLAGCRKEAKWSQSPVLPWAQRVYETCLSAGSTAEGNRTEPLAGLFHRLTPSAEELD